MHPKPPKVDPKFSFETPSNPLPHKASRLPPFTPKVDPEPLCIPFCPKFHLKFETKKFPEALPHKTSGFRGIKWARTIDLHDVNVTPTAYSCNSSCEPSVKATPSTNKKIGLLQTLSSEAALFVKSQVPVQSVPIPQQTRRFLLPPLHCPLREASACTRWQSPRQSPEEFGR